MVSDTYVGEKPWSEWSLITGKLKANTGFDKDEIDHLFTLCKDDLADFHGTKKARHVSGASSYLSTTFCFLLHSLWKNPTEEDLSFTFKTHTDN